MKLHAFVDRFGSWIRTIPVGRDTSRVEMEFWPATADKSGTLWFHPPDVPIRVWAVTIQIADDYVETHEGAWRSAKHRQQWRMTLTEYCQPIWSKPVDQIATADVLAVLKPLWSRTPEIASRLRGRIEPVIDAARALGHVPEDKANPARWKGHLDKLLPKRNKAAQAHHKALPYADVAELVKRLSTPLFASWKAWAEKAGVRFGDIKSFGEQMEKANFVWKRKGSGKGYKGLRLMVEMAPHWQDDR